VGYDFHLSAAGIKLIEINTNPGGALLNVVLGRAQRACCPSVIGLAMAPTEADSIEDALFEVFMAEWRLQRNDAPLKSVAIVGESPEDQYLYLEFLLYQQLFRRHGIEVVICDPRELTRKDTRLSKGAMPIDFVYNQLTDFALEQSAYTAMYLAYLAGEIVLSPHPRRMRCMRTSATSRCCATRCSFTRPAWTRRLLPRCSPLSCERRL
jgi:hypothetical protein